MRFATASPKYLLRDKELTVEEISEAAFDQVRLSMPRWRFFREAPMRWFAMREVWVLPPGVYDLRSVRQLQALLREPIFTQVIGPFRFRYQARRETRKRGL